VSIASAGHNSGFHLWICQKKDEIAVMFHMLHPESLCIERYHLLQSLIIAFFFSKTGGFECLQLIFQDEAVQILKRLPPFSLSN